MAPGDLLNPNILLSRNQVEYFGGGGGDDDDDLFFFFVKAHLLTKLCISL